MKPRASCRVMDWMPKLCLLYTSALGGIDVEANPSVARFKDRINGLPLFAESFEARPPGILPVSYTHLDVYKRQMFAFSALLRIILFGMLQLVHKNVNTRARLRLAVASAQFYILGWEPAS